MSESESEHTQSLVRRLRAGESRAGDALQHMHRGALLRFAARYLGNVHDAEDAIQEVFTRILETDAVPRDFRVWSLRITRNVCLNRLRGKGRRRDDARLATGLDIADERSGELSRLVRLEDRAELNAALERLSAQQREVLILRYIEGLGRGEIAEILELPVSTVKSRLFEGVSRLRQG